MCCRLFRVWRPVAALPVDEMRRWSVGEAFPPHVAVVRQCDVGEDAVGVERVDRVLVRRQSGAGCDTEEASLRVDRVKAAVLTETHPADVVADRFRLPARNRWLQ